MLLTRYLLDLRRRDLYRFFALKLLDLVKYDSADVQIQPHANGIRCDQDIKAVVWLIEQLSLMPPHLWRQSTIDDTALVVGPPLNVRFDVKYIPPRKGHNTVAWLHACVLALQGKTLDFQIGKAVVVHDCEGFGHIVTHLLDERQGGGVAAEVDLIRGYALDCSGPCPAPLIIPNHLHRHHQGPENYFRRQTAEQVAH